MNVLKKISFVAAAFITSHGALSATEMEDKVMQLEGQMQQVHTTTAIGTCGARTALARAEVDGQGWFITADVLYWQARVCGTEYAYSDDGPSANYPIKGDTKTASFDWEWGLRVGLGYNLDYDGWDIRTRYTWFDTSGSGSINAGLNNSIIPLRGSSAITTTPGSTTNQFIFCTSANSTYDFEYNAIDLEMGRAYFVSRDLSFRPHWGLKTAWIDQQQNTYYTGGTPANNNVGLQGNTVTIKDESDFWGLGPRVGVDTQWHLGNGFSFFGNVAGALLFGSFDVTHKEYYSIDNDHTINLTADRRAFSPTVQMQLGLHYGRYINCNRQHIGVSLGFEANYWWRQNQMIAVNDGAVKVKIKEKKKN